MPVAVKGGIELRKALKKFTPDLAKETQREMANLLKPVVFKARGFIPSSAPLSGWGKAKGNTRWVWDGRAAKSGIGYKTTPSKVNRSGFRSLSRIVNASMSGAIYETAGRVNPNGREQGSSFIVQARQNKNFGKNIVFMNPVRRKDKKSETVGVKNYVTLVRCNFGHEYDTASGV